MTDRTGRPGRLNSWAWEKLRQQVLKRDQYLCLECLAMERVTEAREVDHIVPIHQGGGHDLANLASICIPHHRAKTIRERGHEPRSDVERAGGRGSRLKMLDSRIRCVH